MIFQVYVYTCGSCNNVFHDLDLPGEHYGEFLLRTQTGKIAYLYGINSTVYAEVGNIIDSMSELKNLSEVDHTDILQKIFGVACDLALDGSRYQIVNFPRCPSCKSDKMASWQPIYPPKYIEKDVKLITHNYWHKLNDTEKKEAINKAAKLMLCG